ncbi:hypothetical protein chiPu_0033015, partial [Chiloscyllium punctatum]|nr:hypothetical protein [Chiloscyllium punctatum]
MAALVAARPAGALTSGPVRRCREAGGCPGRLPSVSCGVTMAGPLEQAVSMLEQLRSEWSRKNPNLRKCEELLGKLK